MAGSARTWWCRFGIHAWSLWKLAEYVEGKDPYVKQYRKCERCGKLQAEYL
jgi:hypothetical protein